uniref:Uncharacterized protein n=1 Tax=Octopus bimaculoides TaxID=37653 RepID=A0A0L8GLF7_OCTBM
MLGAINLIVLRSEFKYTRADSSFISLLPKTTSLDLVEPHFLVTASVQLGLKQVCFISCLL